MLEQHEDRSSSDDRSFSEVILRSVDEDLTARVGLKVATRGVRGLLGYRADKIDKILSYRAGEPPVTSLVRSQVLAAANARRT